MTELMATINELPTVNDKVHSIKVIHVLIIINNWLNYLVQFPNPLPFFWYRINGYY